jgi:uncharacterized protein GlcG (DUF336 family)
MHTISLTQANAIIEGALEHARSKNLAPLGVAVLDMRGVIKAYAAEDGTSLLRYQLAFGKANAALGMGFGTHELERRAEKRPQFVSALTVASGGTVIPARGGVLIRGDDGAILGAVGISGDHSEHDEEAAVAGITKAGLVADAG